MLRHVRRRLSLHRLAVDRQNHVALAQTRLRRRHTLVRLVYHHVLACEAVRDNGADARILAREHLLVFAHLVLRVILRVRVERSQHLVDGVAHHLVGVQRVDVEQVEVAVDGVEHLKVLRHAVVMVAAVLR